MTTKREKLFLGFAILFACAAAVFAVLYFTREKPAVRNLSDEMKIVHAFDYEDDGADDVERTGDHADSPYYTAVDFYNAKPTESLSILPAFRTVQQTSWWSCGVCAVMMALDYYGCLGDWNEQTLADLRTDHSAQHDGTCLDQILEMLRGASKLTLESTYDHLDNPDTIDYAWIKAQIDAGYPIIVGWNDWGGHWQVIIGYDTMGTPDYTGDDVLIMADSYDSTDHNQDGYGVYSAERFISTFDFYNFFPADHQAQKCFVVVKPAA